MMTDVAVDQEELERRSRRKSSYHLVASRNRLPVDHDDQEDDYMFKYLLEPAAKNYDLFEAKRDFLRTIAATAGDTSDPSFHKSLDRLIKVSQTSFDARARPSRSSSSPQMEGMWISLSQPQFTQCLGRNENNELLYTLGRMTFDMFGPSDLVCSIQGTFNPVHRVRSKDYEKIENIPSCFAGEIRSGKSVVRTYDTVTAFTIEPGNSEMDPKSPNHMIHEQLEGIMTTRGFGISNPHAKDQISVWFTGGSIEVGGHSSTQKWKDVFSNEEFVNFKPEEQDEIKPPRRGVRRFWNRSSRVNDAREQLATTTSIEMEEDGRMTYSLKRPFAGHDKSYVEMLFLDETVRVMRANTGVIYVCARVPYFPDE